MTYQIDRGIPIHSAAKRAKYPFEDMQVGDSFLMPRKGQSNVVYTAAKRGFKVMTRGVDKDTIRVWMVELPNSSCGASAP